MNQDEIKSMVSKFIIDVIGGEQNKILRTASLRYFRSTGKMVRPLLAYHSAHMTNQEANDRQVLIIAAVCEVIHTASLVHDDIMDESKFRRQSQTIHELYGIPTAINTGDFLIFTAYNLLRSLEAEPDMIVQLLGGMSNAVFGVARGQQMDVEMNKNNLKTCTTEYYLQTVRGKTCSIFSFAAESGSFVVGGHKAETRALNRLGIHYGTAHQIIDDLIDLTSKKKLSGKEHFLDLKRGKITLPVIKALEMGKENVRQAIMSNIGENLVGDDEWGKIAELIEGTGAIEVCREVAHNEIERALEWLEVFDDNNSKHLIKVLIDNLRDRKY